MSFNKVIDGLVIAAVVNPLRKLLVLPSIWWLPTRESNDMNSNEPWGAVVDGLAKGKIVNEKTPEKSLSKTLWTSRFKTAIFGVKLQKRLLAVFFNNGKNTW